MDTTQILLLVTGPTQVTRNSNTHIDRTKDDSGDDSGLAQAIIDSV